MIQKILLATVFILGLIYLVWPGPSSITYIPPLPESVKSKEPGDSTQIPNIAAYFSDHRRGAVTKFYRDEFSYLNIFGIKIPAMRANHPPETAFQFIRDQQVSTYLEEYYYPLRDSLFVNGFEPFDPQGKSYRKGATSIVIDEIFYESKTNLRYYGSNVIYRVVVYVLIWVSMFLLWKVGRKVIRG